MCSISINCHSIPVTWVSLLFPFHTRKPDSRQRSGMRQSRGAGLSPPTWPPMVVYTGLCTWCCTEVTGWVPHCPASRYLQFSLLILKGLESLKGITGGTTQCSSSFHLRNNFKNLPGLRAFLIEYQLIIVVTLKCQIRALLLIQIYFFPDCTQV